MKELKHRIDRDRERLEAHSLAQGIMKKMNQSDKKGEA
jgi:hypothetical protein